MKILITTIILMCSTLYGSVLAEVGLGITSSKESVKWLGACGSATECYSETTNNGSALLRLGYKFSNISLYGEVESYRSELDFVNYKLNNLSVNVRYTAYDSLYTSLGYGIQKVSIRDTLTRNVVKMTAGYKINRYLSIEISGSQTGNMRLAHSKNKNRTIGTYILFCFN